MLTKGRSKASATLPPPLPALSRLVEFSPIENFDHSIFEGLPQHNNDNVGDFCNYLRKKHC